MSLKDRYTWMKHYDFILIDLCSLILAFFIAYYLKFDNINIFVEPKWVSLFIVICCMNLFFMLLQGTYSGILKRRYYQQFHRELRLFVSQIATICVVFYAFKIGIDYSREMIFIMFIIYFCLAQPLKYIRKKFVTEEFSFKEKVIKPNKVDVDLTSIDKRSRFIKIVSMVLKRTFDIIGGLVGCIILIPLTALVFILNKINEEDDGPLFFVQDRLGQYGTTFKMIKFRSMVVDADDRLERFLEENEDVRKEFHIYRKIKNDPRITKVGKFLRKTSLDEFPQFINVLKGDMSLVGPRPYLPREVEDMGVYKDVIVNTKPGITGNWQISGRSEASFNERLDFDIQYIKDKSLFKDIKILFKTVVKILIKEGAI